MEQTKTPNYNKKIWTNRTNRTYKTPQEWDIIVNHITEGLMPGVLSYMERPDISVSAHFLITRKGEIYRQADLKHGAWHCVKNKPSAKVVAGRAAPANLYTVGIEHEGIHKDTKGALTPEQYKATLFAHQYIIEQYEKTFKKPFQIDRDHIMGHYEVDTVNRDKSDPGINFPWEELMFDLKVWDKKRKAPPEPVKPAEDLAPDGKLFQVAIGAYKNRTNANDELAKAKSAGLDPYLVLIDDPRGK